VEKRVVDEVVYQRQLLRDILYILYVSNRRIIDLLKRLVQYPATSAADSFLRSQFANLLFHIYPVMSAQCHNFLVLYCVERASTGMFSPFNAECALRTVEQCTACINYNRRGCVDFPFYSITIRT